MSDSPPQSERAISRSRRVFTVRCVLAVTTSLFLDEVIPLYSPLRLLFFSLLFRLALSSLIQKNVLKTFFFLSGREQVKLYRFSAGPVRPIKKKLYKVILHARISVLLQGHKINEFSSRQKEYAQKASLRYLTKFENRRTR